MKKLVKIVGIVMGVIILLLVLFCTVPITSVKLKNIALSKAKPILGREVTIERVRIVLLKGINLDGITIANKEGFTKEPLFSGKRIVVKYELFPLLRKELIIKRVILLEPKILLERNKKGEWNFSGIGKKEKIKPETKPTAEEEKAKRALTITISQVAIKKGEVRLEDRSKGALRSLSARIDLTSRIEMNPAPTSRGGMKEGLASQRRINLNDLIVQLNPPTKEPLKISELKIPYEFKDKVILIKDLLVRTCGGELNAEAKINLKAPEYNLKAKIEKIELNDLLSALTTMKEMLYGTLALDLEVEAKGKGRRLVKGAKGKGFINLTKGKISGLPLQKKLLASLSAALPLPSLAEIPYNSLGGHFDLKEARIKTDDFKLDSDLIKVSAQGTYSLLGRLNFDITVKTTPKLLKPSNVPVQLRDEEGNASLPFELTGTTQNPHFKPKWEKMVKRAIEKTIEEEIEKALPEEEAEVAKELLKGLGELFKKK